MKTSPLLFAVAVLFCAGGFCASTSAAALSQALDGPGITAASSSGAVQWFGEELPLNAHDGVDAARSGAIAESQTSQLSVTVTGPGVLRFWWRVSSERTYDFGWWRLNGSPRPPISGDSGWAEVTAVLAAGSHTVDFFYQKDATVSAGADALWVDQLRVVPPVPVTLAQALDLNSPRLSVNNPGGNSWTGGAAPAITYDGVDAARSGGSSGLSNMIVDVTGPGILSAWVALDPQWMSSSNPVLTMTAARRLFGWTDTAGWTRVEVEIPHGQHPVIWRWEDNSTPLQAEGAGYVDQVSFTAANTTTLAQALDGAGLSWTTDANREWGGLLAPMSNHDGVDAARSGVSFQSGPSGVETTVTGPGVVTFWWRTDGLQGEAGVMFVDGSQERILQIPYGAPWKGAWWPESVNITGPGMHTLRWEYTNPLNGGCLWLDEVDWLPGGYVSLPVGDAVGAPALFGAQPSPSWLGWQGAGLGRDGSAAKSDSSTGGGTLRATLDGPGTLSWWWRSDSTTQVTLRLNGVTRHTGALSRPWQRMEFSIPEGSHTLDWLHNATGVAYVDEVSFTPSAADSLPEAVEAPALVWRSSGASGAWFHQTAESYQEGDAAQAPALPDGGSAWMEADVTGPGVLRFAWKVSSEARLPWLPDSPGDSLSFFTGASISPQVPAIEGETGWTIKEVAIISSGPQKVRWTYSKNGAGSAGQDTAWLDAVTFLPVGPVSIGEAVDAPHLIWSTGGNGAWTGLAGAGDAQQGMDYALSTPSGGAGTSWIETTLPDGGRVSYHCRYTGSAGSLSVLLDGLVVATVLPNALSSSWLKLEAGAPSGQPHILRFECDNASGTWQIDAVSVIPEAVSLGEALESPGLTWSQTGLGGWTGAAAPELSHDGQDVAQAGARSGSLQAAVAGPSAMSFWWRREGSVFNYFSRADGQALAAHQNSGEWERVRTELPGPGPKLLTWAAESGSSGNVFLDEVSITPLTAASLGEALDGGGLTWTTNPAAPWTGWQMPNASKDGVDAAAGATAVAATPSWIEAQWSGAGALTFQAKSSAPGLRQDTFRIALDGGVTMPLNATNWLREVVLSNSPGLHTARWTASTGVNSSVAAGALLDEVAFHPALPLAEALDAPELSWTTGGSGAWIGVPGAVAGAHSGGDAAISHAGPNQETWLETAVTGPGMLSFRYQRASGLDSLAYTMDGAPQWSVSGSSPSWRQRAELIPAGVHTLRWTHSYGAGGAELSTRALLDAVSFTPALSDDLAAALDAPGLVPRTGGTGGWLSQDELSYDGVDALESAWIASGAESWIEFDVSGAQFITFHLAAQVVRESATQFYTASVRFTLDGTRQFSQSVPVTGAWRKVTVRAQGTGTHTLRISLVPTVSDSSQFSLLVDALAFEPLANVPLVDALEWPAFTTSATAPWQGFAAAAAGFDGVDFAAPGDLDFTGTSWLETTVTGPGRLRYNQRVTPASNYQASGFTRFLRVNGAAQSAFGESVAVDLSAGSKTLRWEYNRTGSPTLRAPDWHLDQVSFVRGTTLAEALDRPSQSWTASSGWGGLLSTADSHDGVDVANVEDLPGDTDSWVESSFSGPGKLTFLMRRSGPVPAALRMSVSGQEVPWTLEETEASGWERGSLLLSGRQQTVRWTFRKPTGALAGSGGVFLDEVSLLAVTPVSLPQALDAETLDWITGPNEWAGFSSGGIDWAASADVAPGSRSWVETTMHGPGFISYRAGIFGDAVSPGTLRVWLPAVMDGDEETMVRGSIGWEEQQRVYITRDAPQRVRWTYRDRDATFGNTASSAALDAVTFVPAVPLAQVFSGSGLTWTTSPQQPWIGVNDGPVWPDFPLHAVSGPSGDSKASWLETSVTGPASVRFDWRATGLNTTSGTLWMDDQLVQVLDIDGTWRLVVPAGTHRVRWQRRQPGAPDVTGGARLANVALLPWPGDLVDMPDTPWLLRENGWSLLNTGTHDGEDALALSGIEARLAGRVVGPGVFTSWQHENNGAWAKYTETLTTRAGRNIRRFSGYAGIEWRHDEFDYQTAPSVSLAEALDAPSLTWTTDGAALWQGFGAPMQATEGGDAAAAGIIGSGEESWIETSVTGPGRLSFLYTASTSLTWSVDGVPFPLAQHGTANQEGYSSAALQLPAGLHTIRWTQRCPAGSDESPPVSLDRVTFTGDVTADDLAEALDAAAYPWITSGLPSWRGQSAVSHDGSDAAAAMRYPSQLLQTTVTGPGVVSFWWRRDTPFFDNPTFSFQVNSENFLNAVPNAGWDRVERIVSGSGPQVLQWTLSATGNSYSPADHGWLDQFAFAPAPAVPLPQALDAPAFTWNTSPAAPWMGVAGAAFSSDGVDAAVAGAPSPDNDSWLETQVEGPGTVSFLWRRTAGNAPLLCEIDGQLRGSATNVDFKPASFEFLTGGTHNIRWILRRSADSDPAAAAAVDAFDFTPLPEEVTYHAYAAANIPPAFLQPDEDADGDGLANIVEFAHGLDPASDDTALVAAPLGLPVIRLVTGGDGLQYCELQFPRRRSTSAHSQQAEFSTGPAGPWAVSSITPVVIPVDDDWEIVTVRDVLPALAPARRFGRVRVASHQPEY